MEMLFGYAGSSLPQWADNASSNGYGYEVPVDVDPAAAEQISLTGTITYQ